MQESITESSKISYELNASIYCIHNSLRVELLVRANSTYIKIDFPEKF